MDITLRALDASGAVVLDLTGTPGYSTRALPASEVTWRRNIVTSPWVDGDSEATPPTLAALTMELVVRVSGASWVEVEQRRAALIAAVAGSASWLLEIGVEGVVEVWRASRADSSSPRRISDVKNLVRTVSLSIPVQPTAAVTGV